MSLEQHRCYGPLAPHEGIRGQVQKPFCGNPVVVLVERSVPTYAKVIPDACSYYQGDGEEYQRRCGMFGERLLLPCQYDSKGDSEITEKQKDEFEKNRAEILEKYQKTIIFPPQKGRPVLPG
ncbi:MAG: hypothetical protein ACFFD2_11090 [Promethearchaeota archaeon]